MGQARAGGGAVILTAVTGGDTASVVAYHDGWVAYHDGWVAYHDGWNEPGTQGPQGSLNNSLTQSSACGTLHY